MGKIWSCRCWHMWKQLQNYSFPLYGKIFKSIIKFHWFRLFKIHPNTPWNKRNLNALYSCQVIFLFPIDSGHWSFWVSVVADVLSLPSAWCLSERSLGPLISSLSFYCGHWPFILIGFQELAPWILDNYFWVIYYLKIHSSRRD